MTDLQSVLSQPAPILGSQVLGAVLSTTRDGIRVAVRITEVEAYLGAQDPGSHAFRGETKRNSVMFGPAGRLYVYFTYGMHYCTNIVCGEEGMATGLLLRGGEVVDGVETAKIRRSNPRRDRDLARGPANLTQALGLNMSYNGVVLNDPEAVWETDLQLPAMPPPTSNISTGPRVGVSGPGGTEKYPWRFWLTGEPTVSAYRPAVVRQRKRAREDS